MYWVIILTFNLCRENILSQLWVTIYSTLATKPRNGMAGAEFEGKEIQYNIDLASAHFKTALDKCVKGELQ